MIVSFSKGQVRILFKTFFKVTISICIRKSKYFIYDICIIII